MNSPLIRLSLSLSRVFLFLGLAGTVAVTAVYLYAFAGVLIIYRILWPRASRFLEHSTNFTPAAARAR